MGQPSQRALSGISCYMFADLREHKIPNRKPQALRLQLLSQPPHPKPQTGSCKSLTDMQTKTFNFFNHPEVDRIWGIQGIHHIVLSRIIFYLLQDICKPWVPNQAPLTHGAGACNCQGKEAAAGQEVSQEGPPDGPGGAVACGFREFQEP